MKIKVKSAFLSKSERKIIKAGSEIEVDQKQFDILVSKGISDESLIVIEILDDDVEDNDVIDSNLVDDFGVEINGSWFAFPDGKKLQGRDAAVKYAESLGDVDEDLSTDKSTE